jgi:hypothetical protein
LAQIRANEEAMIMNETEVLPAPEIELPPVSPSRWSKWEQERAAFRRLLPTLLSTFRGRYVAIHEGQVIDSDEDQIALALRVYAKGYRQVYVGLVSEEPPVLRVPYRRFLKSGLAP